MDLWIRTQNNGLHQIIGINEPYIQKDCVALIGYSNYKHIELGVYKTKERALEVLDEILDILKPRLFVKYNEFGEQELYEKITQNVIYKMPEE